MLREDWKKQLDDGLERAEQQHARKLVSQNDAIGRLVDEVVRYV